MHSKREKQTQYVFRFYCASNEQRCQPRKQWEKTTTSIQAKPQFCALSFFQASRGIAKHSASNPWRDGITLSSQGAPACPLYGDSIVRSLHRQVGDLNLNSHRRLSRKKIQRLKQIQYSARGRFLQPTAHWPWWRLLGSKMWSQVVNSWMGWTIGRCEETKTTVVMEDITAFAWRPCLSTTVLHLKLIYKQNESHKIKPVPSKSSKGLKDSVSKSFWEAYASFLEHSERACCPVNRCYITVH